MKPTDAWDDQTPRDPLEYAVSMRDKDVLSLVRTARLECLKVGRGMQALSKATRRGECDDVSVPVVTNRSSPSRRDPRICGSPFLDGVRYFAKNESTFKIQTNVKI